ncbi:hypothetical protein GQX74_014297 [Glossina fuscipes]|nr:hypothetical protein GQX74_014297 [Glossina fuscipes]
MVSFVFLSERCSATFSGLQVMHNTISKLTTAYQAPLVYLLYLLTLLNLHANCEPTKVPFTKSSILPEASRTAAPPANITNMAYEIMDKSKAQKVPFGIASPGSFRSPQILAPA